MITRRDAAPPNDEVRSDGDAGFIGVNLKMVPDKLPIALAAGAVNKVFRDGRAATRGGLQTPVHFQPHHAARLLPPCDYLVVTLRWKSPENGYYAILRLQGMTTDFVAPYVAFAAAQVPTLAEEQIYAPGGPYGTVMAVHGPPVQTGQSQGYFNFKTLRDNNTGGFANFTVQALWASGSVSYGGNAAVELVLDAYQGGTMTYDGNGYHCSGTLTHSVTIASRMLTDSYGFPPYSVSPPFDNLVEIAMQDSPGTVVLRVPGESDNLANIGEGTFVPAAPSSLISAGIMAESDGREFLLLATPDGIWQVRDGTTWREKPIEVVTIGTDLTAPTIGDFVQFAGRVLLFRGPDATRLRWEGGAADEWVLDQGDEDPGDGTSALPNATTAEVINNRLAIIQGRNEVIFSDIARFRYNPLTSLFRINTGANETLVRLLPFTATSLLVFTTRSVYLLDNISGTLSSVSLAEVNRRLGLAARLAVAQIGADVFFLTREGVFRISQVVESRIATAPVAVSDPIEPFFRDRVNWRAIAGACACVVGEYFYLALPIDESAVNNALLPYNLTSQQWEGVHTFPDDVALSRLLATDYNGRRRLFAADYGKGYVYLVHEGACDRIGTTVHEISDELTTRGYTFEGMGFKTLTLAEVTLDTLRPSFSVELQLEGVNETRALATDRTKSRTRSYLFGVPPYTLNNANNDHAAPGRQDYSVVCSDGIKMKTAGVNFDREQQTQERFPVRAQGRYAQLVISSTQGKCDVVSVRVEARHKENRRRVGF